MTRLQINIQKVKIAHYQKEWMQHNTHMDINSLIKIKEIYKHYIT